MEKQVYFFGDGKADGNQGMKNLLGGKGANLHEMSKLGLPVPPGFTITTEVCTHYYKNGKSYPENLKAEVEAAMQKMEKSVGLKFADAENPLLVSVRSGARASMPGMMDTILNLGLNDETVKGLAKASKDPRFAYDAYRRFIQMYSDVVMSVPLHEMERLLDQAREKRGVKTDAELTAEDLEKLCKEFKKIVVQESGKDFPQDPKEQLWGAISAVFSS